MRFLIRRISRTVDGREIVRPQAVTGDTLSIGRGPHNDINLPDLAVTPRHAAIHLAPGLMIEIESARRRPMEVNGRSVRRAVIDPSAGAEIHIGAHRLTVSRGADNVCTIDVERLSEGDWVDTKGEGDIFSLRGTLPGKRMLSWAFALMLLAVFLAWPIRSSHKETPPPPGPAKVHADILWSPGPLSLAHASLEGDCKACHRQPFVAVRDAACRACHVTVHDHADPLRLAKAMPPDAGRSAGRRIAAAFNIPPGRCVECHIEHQGAQKMPDTPQHFCTDCHGGLSERLPDARIPEVSDFGTDHPEFRPAVMVGDRMSNPLIRRIAIGGPPVEDNGLRFPHRMHLSAVNGVAQMSMRLTGKTLECRNCHVPDDSGVRFKPVTMEGNCKMCHSLAFDRDGQTIRTLRHGDAAQVIADLKDFYASNRPRRPSELEGDARRRPGDAVIARAEGTYLAALGDGGRATRAIRAVFSQGGACYGCHEIVGPSRPGGLDYRVVPVRLPMRYMAHGWFDHAAHDSQDCASCHSAARSDRAADLLLPGIATCRQCHGGEGSRAQVPSSCAMCHDYHRGTGAPEMIRMPTKKTPKPSVTESQRGPV